MIVALYLFALQGLMGAFDTLYYHEWRARLPGGVPGTAPELRLHGVRSVIYSILFGALPFVRFEGLFTWVLAVLLLTEIVITLCDFVVEDTVRRPMGGVFAGERVTHAVMGIIYGAALGHMVPDMIVDAARPTALSPWEAPAVLRMIMPLMSAGVFISGVRDLLSLYGPRWARYPWAGA